VAAARAARWAAGRDASPPAWAGRGRRADAVALRRSGWRLFPLAQAAVRGTPMAGRVKASSSTASRRVRACRCPRTRRPRTAMNGPKSYPYGMRFPSIRANGADRAGGSRSSRRIQGRCHRPPSSPPHAWSAAPESQAREENHKGTRPPNQKGRAALPSRADGCLVPTGVPSLGRAPAWVVSDDGLGMPTQGFRDSCCATGSIPQRIRDIDQ
jgi:hypothetical protein